MRSRSVKEFCQVPGSACVSEHVHQNKNQVAISLFALWRVVPENGDPGQGLESEADEQVAQKIDDEYEVGTEVDGQQEQVIPPDQSEEVILIFFYLLDHSVIQIVTNLSRKDKYCALKPNSWTYRYKHL